MFKSEIRYPSIFSFLVLALTLSFLISCSSCSATDEEPASSSEQNSNPDLARKTDAVKTAAEAEVERNKGSLIKIAKNSPPTPYVSFTNVCAKRTFVML